MPAPHGRRVPGLPAVYDRKADRYKYYVTMTRCAARMRATDSQICRKRRLCTDERRSEAETEYVLMSDASSPRGVRRVRPAPPHISAPQKVSICGVPYLMQIVDGGVLFSKKSSFYQTSGRFMFAFRNRLWWLEHAESAFGHVSAVHLQRMHELLCEKIGSDHEDFPLRFKTTL
jgi:hypothetical protein